MLKKVALLSATMLFCALMFELGVLALMGEQPKFPRRVVGGPAGVRINEPNATYRQKSADITVWFRINSQGMRADADFALDKPPGVVRIVSLGDSFTVGYEVDAEDTFSAILGEELGQQGHEVEVLNAGVSGFSNAEALVSLERDLHRYDPDIVMISFYGNDLVDNVRTNLFRVEDGELVEGVENYIPLGPIGNFLNTNPIFNWLSGYSNAFVVIKEKLTLLVKADLVQQNLENVRTAKEDTAGPSYDRVLAAGIFDRLYAFCQERDIALLVHSIPSLDHDGLRELFPSELFDVNQPDMLFVPSQKVLSPHFGKTQLYWYRSHGHWTPFSHRLAGEELARAVAESGWLESAPN